VITYPGGVFGPVDPYAGEQVHLIQLALRGLMPVVPRGGAAYCDARDAAAVHLAALTKGAGPRRYVVPGHYKTVREELDAIGRAAGRRLRAGSMSTNSLLRMGRPTEALLRITKVRYPATRETIWLLSRKGAPDSSHTEAELGLRAIDFDQSVADTLQSMLEMGQINPRLVPALR
jgi:nucleoside-diphosphate-sugar epimerase